MIEPEAVADRKLAHRAVEKQFGNVNIPFPPLFSISLMERFESISLSSELLEFLILGRNPFETTTSKRSYIWYLEIWLKMRICQFCRIHVLLFLDNQIPTYSNLCKSIKGVGVFPIISSYSVVTSLICNGFCNPSYCISALMRVSQTAALHCCILLFEFSHYYIVVPTL